MTDRDPMADQHERNPAEYDCPDEDCDAGFDDIREVIRHARDEHGFEAFSHLVVILLRSVHRKRGVRHRRARLT